MVDFVNEVLINQLDVWSARMLRKLQQLNDLILCNSFHSHEYGKN